MNPRLHPIAALLLPLLAAGCAPSVPEVKPIREARWLEQNWGAGERFWYHHATQGTNTFKVPYDWFVALEQPTLKLFGEVPLFRDPHYLRGFGFIPSVPGQHADPQAMAAQGYGAEGGRAYGKPVSYRYELFPGNEHQLPVGFARTPAKQNPVGDQDLLGLTCAACHTGQLEYQGISIRIDGGPAIIDLGKFREALGLAMAYTKYVPGRFDRFAERVLGPAPSDDASAALEQAFDTLLERGQQAQKTIADREQALEQATGKQPVEEGFGRLDALNRIGNQVFATAMVGAQGVADPYRNWALIDAPVNFPHIWSTSWFNWVQYDASIQQPMVRNAGESLGVAAEIDLGQGSPQGLYSSSTQFTEVFAMEELLAGSEPPTNARRFTGLRAPKWPADLFGPVDDGKAVRGKALYGELCEGCHRPPVDAAAFWDGDWWTEPNDAGQRYLKLKQIEVDEIGTDPAQAEVLHDRMVEVPDYLRVSDAPLCNGQADAQAVKTEALFATALASVVAHSAEFWYDKNQVPPAERQRMNGYRPNCVKADQVYKARPLNGIWATPPFLHNGSVPTLYDLLSPADDRPERFCLGSRQFDPHKIGYETACSGGDFELDTQLTGNRNRGHEFRDGPVGGGVIGRALSEQERWDLVEYLKTL